VLALGSAGSKITIYVSTDMETWEEIATGKTWLAASRWRCEKKREFYYATQQEN
jgi:hypothetical protein